MTVPHRIQLHPRFPALWTRAFTAILVALVLVLGTSPVLASPKSIATDSSDGDGSMICIDMKQLNGWLRTQLAARKDAGS